MGRGLFLSFVMIVAVCLNAGALTGTGDSGPGTIETVSPALSDVSAATESSLSATFSEPMRTPGATAPGAYSVSGVGAGTLGLNPSGVAGTGPFTLTWASCEMRDGATVALTATGLQDVVGNPLDPAHDSVSCAGMGIAPSFTDLVAEPSQAAVGDTVTIRFRVSEALGSNPTVTVNGHAASFVSDDSYRYVVTDTDALGMAIVSISGADLAGNPGDFSSGSALEIIEGAAPLPVRIWPLGLLLLAVGMVAMAWRRRRFGALLLVMALLAAPGAWADSPAVSNVTFTQVPNANSTQVEIHYDLSAPNGPCAITLSLSKDGGADGFVHPITHYTGDIANVVTGVGYHIVWDVRADYPEENMTNARIRVTADDSLVQHVIAVTSGGHGSVGGDGTYDHGATVTLSATADTGYHFVNWTEDGTEVSTDPGYSFTATSARTLVGNFAIDTYTITCNVEGDGACSANPATVDHDSTSDITVTPAANWHIVSVVDSEEGSKPGSYTTTAVTANRTITATFAIDTYIITCDAVGNGTCAANPATVNHGSTSDITVTPAVGWHIVSVVDSEEGSKAGSYTTTPVTGNRTVTATFTIDTYTITCNVVGNGTCSADPATVNHGSTSDITVTAAANWHIVSVVDSVEGSKPGSYTTTTVTANRTVTATFERNRYDVTCNAVGNGTCSADPASVEYGFTSNITVTPALGWYTAMVEDSEEGVKPLRSYTTTPVTASRTVTATFGVNRYPITCDVVGDGTCSANPAFVNHGSTSDITVTPAVGWYIVSVVDSEEGPKAGSYTTTPMTAGRTVTATFALLAPVVTSFAIDNGLAMTTDVLVTLNNTCISYPVDYMASESASFAGASWTAYGAAPSFTLSGAVGPRTVYFKVRNGTGESGVVNDTIFVEPTMLSVGSGTFTMGRLTTAGNDQTYGSTDEDPQHAVTLGTYRMGKGEVTNGEYCDVLNWALAQGDLRDSTGSSWGGTGDIYFDGDGPGPLAPILIVAITQMDCDIEYSGVVFSPKTRVGLPGSTIYSMATHPMVRVSWYGAAAFCNWLSEMRGLTPCYDVVSANWPLTTAPPTPGGYRLPTEAEWERAAAWDGSKHWIYGFASDTLTGSNRCNYQPTGAVNPLGLTAPYTSPVAWFDGIHVSPNGNVTTVNSLSPAGAYDMSGNAYEWCHDWYLNTYYTSGGPTWNNPTGPAPGSGRVVRGGGWDSPMQDCRTANRGGVTPANSYGRIGFRIAKSVPLAVTSFAINSGAATANNPVVTLNNTATNSPTDYMASESASFAGANWQTYAAAPSLTLSGALGWRTVYFKVRNVNGEADVVIDTIFLVPDMVSVAAGTFSMGRRSDGDDATYGASNELPVHTVTLGAYQIGRGTVTNMQYCDVLNWALAKGYLKDSAGAAWTGLPGQGNIYTGGILPKLIVAIVRPDCNIQYSGGVFSPKTRTGMALGGGTTTYSMDTHPVVQVSWYGSVLFCNWLSEMQGLTPCYDTLPLRVWPLTTPPPTPGGYRLPTEAEWERAAAWDGSKHWIYGFTSDTLTGKNRANYYDAAPDYVNPLGLTTQPYTTPNGWFDGLHVNPNGNVTTVSSASPTGAYDMSGNIYEWCHDLYLDTYYSSEEPPWSNPTGPSYATGRALRGGSWNSYARGGRTAFRADNDPGHAENYCGFRVVRSN